VSRHTVITLAIALLIVTVALNAFRLSSTMTVSARLTDEIDMMRDSVALMRRMVDSLKARTPGLGEYMSTIQLHTSKLWFAARALNWELARYERDELAETMEAAGALHAVKDSVDVTAVLQGVRNTQLPLLGRAIARRSLPSFEKAYGETIAACNGCHAPAGYGFIRIITPSREPVTNQAWKPVH